MHTLRGTPHFTFSAMVQNTIATHGLHFAVQYYCKKHKLCTKQFRVFAGI